MPKLHTHARSWTFIGIVCLGITVGMHLANVAQPWQYGLLVGAVFSALIVADPS